MTIATAKNTSEKFNYFAFLCNFYKNYAPKLLTKHITYDILPITKYV